MLLADRRSSFRVSVEGGGLKIQINKYCSFITGIMPLHEKLLQFDWLRAVVFQLNLKLSTACSLSAPGNEDSKLFSESSIAVPPPKLLWFE